MALKVLLCSSNDALPQHLIVLRAIHTLNRPKNYSRLLGGLSTIHSTHWIGAQGLMCMVVLVDVGCWRLTSDQPTLGIVTIVYGSNFFVPT